MLGGIVSHPSASRPVVRGDGTAAAVAGVRAAVNMSTPRDSGAVCDDAATAREGAGPGDGARNAAAVEQGEV